MSDTITITGGSVTDSITVSDTTVIDLNGYGAGQSMLTSTALPSLSIDDIVTTSVTLPSSYSITGGTGVSFANSSYTWAPNPTTVTINQNGLSMEEGTDIKVGGKSLMQAIDKIEERLGILKPNPELEERWDKLKDLRQQYIELEKDLLEKEKIMKILKET